MAWTLTASIEEYLAGAGDFLRARPVEHTIELAALERLRASGPAAFGRQPPLLGWWRSPAGGVAASAFHTPPYPLLLSGPAASGPVAAPSRRQRRGGARGGVRRRLAGPDRGPVPRAPPVAAVPPRRPDGPDAHAARSGQDRRPRGPGLLVRWLADFAAEMDDLPGGAAGDAAASLSYGGLMLWEAGGIPVAMAGRTRPGAGVVRVGPVFTPRDQRRHGYGGAVTAAVSRAALEAGAAAVVLFTDLANPTSNALYPRLGYRPVADRVVLAFDPATCS